MRCCEERYTCIMTAIRIFLLVLIVIGLGLLTTQRLWVPPLVSAILAPERGASVPAPAIATPVATSTAPIPPKPPVKGTVAGSVFLSPICPVEHNPPDPRCAPKGYQTSIRIYPASAPTALLMTISSDAAGMFRVSLSPGTYIFQPAGGASMPPTCQSAQATVSAGKTGTLNLSCDTGIR